MMQRTAYDLSNRLSPDGSMRPQWEPNLSHEEVYFDRLPPFLTRQEERVMFFLRECFRAACDLHLPAGVALQDWLCRRVPQEAQELSQIWSPSFTPVFASAPPPPPPLPPQQHDSKLSGKRNCVDLHQEPPAKQSRTMATKDQRILNAVSSDVGGKASVSQKGKGKTKQKYDEKVEAYLSTLPEGEFTAGQRIDKETRENMQKESFDNFFASLPGDSFLDEELSLREALLEFLHRRAEEDPNIAPTVTEAKKCVPRIQNLCTSFFPLGVGLKDWVECRIADEVEVSWDEARGRHSVLVLLDAVSGDVGGKGKGAQKGFRTGIDKKRSPEQIEAFVSALPEGEFTADELRLREALVDFLDRYEKQHPGVAPRMSEAKPERSRVAWYCKRVLPERVGLGDWIRHRLAEEVTTEWDEERHCTVLVRVHDE